MVAQGSTFGFRPIRDEDKYRPEIVNFSCGSNYWELEIAEFVKDERIFSLHQPPKKLSLLLCEDEGTGQILGYCNVSLRRLKPEDSPSGGSLQGLHIVSLGIDTIHQGHGLGKLIMGAIIERSKTDELAFVDLFVHTDNKRAQRLYGSVGFEHWDGADYLDGPHRYIRMILFL